MDNIHRYFFIMPTLARFEFEVHTRMENDEPLTPETLNEIMSGFYAEGYGETMTDDARRTGITWAQFGHLYEAYYTFQYATGISAAHALANAILAGDDAGAVERYHTFLRAGSSDYAIPVLKEAGVDMSTPLAVEETFKVLEGLGGSAGGLDLSGAPGAPLQIDRDAAIDMAVYSGNLLYTLRDDRHFWAMTLMISNLFELVGEGAETLERFDNGFYTIMGQRTDRAIAFGWDNGCIARAVRNIIVHGMSLNRTQRKNFKSPDRAAVVSIGFIPASIGQGREYVYDVTLVGEEQYIIHFSPTAFWPYVQQWYESRNRQ